MIPIHDGRLNFEETKTFRYGNLLGLWNILKHDHWCSPVVYNALIIW